jgi:hypothetical protein
MPQQSLLGEPEAERALSITVNDTPRETAHNPLTDSELIDITKTTRRTCCSHY